ncbi:MAG: HD domain-containing protein, partial [Bacteroidota bacterium]
TFTLALAPWYVCLLAALMSIAMVFGGALSHFPWPQGEVFMRLPFVGQAVPLLVLGFCFARHRQLRSRLLPEASHSSKPTYHQAILSPTKQRSSVYHREQLFALSEALTLEKGAEDPRFAALQEHLTLLALQLSRLDELNTSYVRLEVSQLKLNVFLQLLRKALKMQGLHENLIITSESKDLAWQADMTQMMDVLVRGVSYLRLRAGAQCPILLHVSFARLGYIPHKQGYREETAAWRFVLSTSSTMPPMPRCYGAQGYLKQEQVPTTMQQWLLSTNTRVVRAHYGHATYMKEPEEAAEPTSETLVYVVPTHVRRVRSVTLDTAEYSQEQNWLRADDLYPGAQQQEADLLDTAARLPGIDMTRCKGALEFIKWYYGPQHHAAGMPRYLHSVAVAQQVLSYSTQEETLLAALLYDTLEATPWLLQQIGVLFGRQTQALLSSVHRLSTTHAATQAIHTHLVVLLSGKDHRALYIKLVDRLLALREAEDSPLHQQWPIAHEIARHYVSLARQLRLHDMAGELRTRSDVVLRKRHGGQWKVCEEIDYDPFHR